MSHWVSQGCKALTFDTCNCFLSSDLSLSKHADASHLSYCLSYCVSQICRSMYLAKNPAKGRACTGAVGDDPFSSPSSAASSSRNSGSGPIAALIVSSAAAMSDSELLYSPMIHSVHVHTCTQVGVHQHTSNLHPTSFEWCTSVSTPLDVSSQMAVTPSATYTTPL